MDVAPLIERLWVGNAGRNFNYLVACPRTGEALVIDPLDAALCLGTAASKGWRITQVLNTHEHAARTAATPPCGRRPARGCSRIGAPSRGLGRSTSRSPTATS